MRKRILIFFTVAFLMQTNSAQQTVGHGYVLSSTNEKSDSILFAEIASMIKLSGFNYQNVRVFNKEAAKHDLLKEMMDYNILEVKINFFDLDTLVKPLYEYTQYIFNCRDSAKLFADYISENEINKDRFEAPFANKLMKEDDNICSRVYLSDKTVNVLFNWSCYQDDISCFEVLLLKCDSLKWSKVYK